MIAALSALGGLLGGLLYFAALRASLGSPRRMLPLALLRLGCAALALWAAAQAGALALLAMLGGFLVARTVMLRRIAP